MALINISNIPGFEDVSLNGIFNISFAQYLETIKPLIYFILGITVYSLFIFKFYRFIAKREVIELGLDRYNVGREGIHLKISKVFYFVVEYLLFIPFYVFFWSMVMAIILVFLSKTASVRQVLVISISLVAVIRIASYYNENLSQDLAKMIPFAFLGIFLVDASYITFDQSLDLLKQMVLLIKEGIYYLLFVIGLEFTLRLINGIYTFLDLRRNEE